MKDLSWRFFSTHATRSYTSDFNLLAHTMITDTRLFLVTESLTRKKKVKNLLIIGSIKMIYYS